MGGGGRGRWNIKLGGNPGNLGRGNHPCQQLLSSTFSLRVPDGKYNLLDGLKYLPFHFTNNDGEVGEDVRICKDPERANANDLQRSAE